MKYICRILTRVRYMGFSLMRVCTQFYRLWLEYSLFVQSGVSHCAKRHSLLCLVSFLETTGIWNRYFTGSRNRSYVLSWDFLSARAPCYHAIVVFLLCLYWFIPALRLLINTRHKSKLYVPFTQLKFHSIIVRKFAKIVTHSFDRILSNEGFGIIKRVWVFVVIVENCVSGILWTFVGHMCMTGSVSTTYSDSHGGMLGSYPGVHRFISSLVSPANIYKWSSHYQSGGNCDWIVQLSYLPILHTKPCFNTHLCETMSECKVFKGTYVYIPSSQISSLSDLSRITRADERFEQLLYLQIAVS